METLKQVLAVPMYGAAAWLAWVVWQQSGRGGLLAVLAGAAGILVAARLLARRQRAGAGAPAWIFLPLGLTAAMLVNVATLQPSASAAPLVAGAERFSPARLESLRAAHRPVLVDMSAAWCITCLVNERVALSPAAVRDALARKNVALLAGDWTRQDPDITAFLHEYGRNGVPLYVYFPPDGAPQILPQILTKSEILGRIGA
jgi:thiol:disulfide interchange protein DsbD